jgi:hypothetical protein
MSKGGSTTSEVTVPQYIEDAARRNLSRADDISNIGYVPYYGPDVAAFTPMQQNAFQNTANAAGAFGMAGGGGTGMEGMPTPTTYAGGISGYSSAPMYEQSLAELEARRPGQYNYINDLFIDPYTGQPGSRAGPEVDYTAPIAPPVDTGSGGAPSISTDSGSQIVPGTTLTQDELGGYAGVISPSVPYNPVTDVLNEEQREYVNNSEEARLAQYDVNSSILGNANNSILDDIKTAVGLEPTFDSPSSAGSYGGSLVTGRPSTSVGTGPTYNPNLSITNPITNNTSTGGYDFDPTDFNSSYLSTPEFSFTGPETTVGANGRSSYSGNYSNIGSSSDPVTGVSEEVDLPGNVLSRALNIGDGKKDDDGNYAGKNNDGCVVATHAVNSGAFSPTTKREAVVWCMNVLHGKWWGEAIRRGYRYCGNKKIEQGKAREHYSEFRRYIDFANGKKRTVAGAITFTLRTAQFFAVGLIKKDA